MYRKIIEKELARERVMFCKAVASILYQGPSKSRRSVAARVTAIMANRKDNGEVVSAEIGNSSRSRSLQDFMMRCIT